MLHECIENIPIVAVYNYLEYFFSFLSRAGNESIMQERQHKGDFGLFWLIGKKLLFVSTPIKHLDFIQSHAGLEQTIVVYPSEPSYFLCLDILKNPNLIQSIIAYAGENKAIQLIPYATTHEFLLLVDELEKKYGLNVILPESPDKDNLWIRDYIGTKSGFRNLLSFWLSDSSKLPFGFVAQDEVKAVNIAKWLLAGGQSCVVKADIGGSGIGNVFLNSDDQLSSAQISEKIKNNKFLQEGLVVVEQLISSPRSLSPSLELYIPPSRKTEPLITYLSQQLFDESGGFCGVLISKELSKNPWYPVLSESGITIARRLQEMGYVGHFDLDCVVDEEDRVFLLEINARRTGGTYVHEYAQRLYGVNYLEKVALLSDGNMKCDRVNDLSHLKDLIGNLIFQPDVSESGIVITSLSRLAYGRIGIVIIAPTTEKAIDIRNVIFKKCNA
jgi:hypothetical protein